ncbi:hypothetical protein [Niallia circulans]|uniref:Uncharacterized protein n=1 Tax=Niallia circulans TaxID=1397 RepID=A0A941JH30_NIACI|nr:hypothetical protein [Niallia circulans]MCB5235522.1 hypothetical protein [Niallia circulans]
MGKKKQDKWDWMIESLEDLREDIWEDQKIHDLNSEEQTDMKYYFNDFLFEKRNELAELEGRISDWEEIIDQKLLYLRFINELGNETVQVLDFIRSNFYHDMWVLFAPKGYWNSASRIEKINLLSSGHKENAIKYLQRLNQEILDDVKITYEDDTQTDKAIVTIIKKTVLPLIKQKIDEITAR